MIKVTRDTFRELHFALSELIIECAKEERINKEFIIEIDGIKFKFEVEEVKKLGVNLQLVSNESRD